MSGAYKVDPNLMATGNIAPSVFVTIDTSNDFGVVQATANALTIGVSQPGTHYPPGTPSDSGYAYISGDPANVYSVGDVCSLTLGGTVTRGDLLESDANGKGVTSSTAGHNVGAIALESGSAGEQRLVLVVCKNHP